MDKNLVKDGVVCVTKELDSLWTPALEEYLGHSAVASLSDAKRKAIVGIAAYQHSKFNNGQIALESDFAYLNGDNSNMAMNVTNPTAGGSANNVAQPGTKGSGDRQFLVGLCISIAAKTIGLELVQTVPATSANVTVKYLNVVYNGGDVANAANKNLHVITLTFVDQPAVTAFKAGTKYVVGHPSATAGKMEFLEVTYIKPARNGSKAYIFEIGDAFTATETSGALTDIVILGVKPAIGQVVANGKFYDITTALDTISAEKDIASVDNTTAIENYAPHQTTKGLHRTLTRSEADAGTDRQLELELTSDAFVIGNRVFTAHVSRLNKKRLEEQGTDPVQYISAAVKNEVSQEINYQIISAARSFGITNAVEFARRGLSYNTFIGVNNVASKAFASLLGADELYDKDGNAVAAEFPDIDNLTRTMQYETIASIGTYLCMLISQVAYAIGTDSRYGEGDAVVLASGLAGYLAASSQYTKLSDKDVDMTASTGAKLSGYIGDIKVYVDVQIPMNSPFITVLRTNQDIKVDMPGIDGDQILVPGLAFLVKDLVSSTELVPEGTGGTKLIIDSETDLVAIGQRPEAGYLTFAFDVKLPGLTLN